MSGPRGLQLSGTQVTASVLATLTGAVAASYLGVGGTLVGAAVGSVASTMGTEIYKHYLLRSQERLRSAGQVLYQGAARGGTARARTGNTMSQTRTGAASGGRHAASAGQASPEGATQDLGDRDTAVWDRRQYGTPRDLHETQTIPGVPAQWNGMPNGGPASSAASGGGSRPGGPASQHAHGDLSGEVPAGDPGGRGGLWAAVTDFFGSLTRRQWLTYSGIAAGFFLLIMAAITVFELSVGKPLSAVVTGHHTSGTSMFGTHSSSRHKVTTHPSSSPSATPTGSTPASATPSAATSTGAPAPSSSVGGTSPSALPSATPTAGSGAAARSAATATPAP